MQRVDRLLLKAEQAHQESPLQVSVAFAKPFNDKWQAVIDLWDGALHGETKRLVIECENQKKALEEIEKVKAEYTPKKYGAKVLKAVTLIDDITE